ncbi:MAG: hypothetical protein NTV46_20980 [Verrucomicrobia bacterium]|nr:hypothetical protein [Verrucomicrobiota bacterium]
MSQSQQTATQPASMNADKLCTGKSVDLGNAWESLRGEARRMVAEEPTLQQLVDDVILSRATLAAALGAHLARRMAREDMPRDTMEQLFTDVFAKYPHIVPRVMRDMLAMFERDAACFSLLEPLLFFGTVDGAGWRFTCKASPANPSPWTSIRPPASAAASSSTTPLPLS